MSAERFIQLCSKMMANWGMPLTAARALAYILLQSKPVNIDEIAGGLGISRAGAWGATRHLEQVGQLERVGEQGSKRALYLPSEDFSRAMFNYSRLLGRMGALMREGAQVASGEVATERLRHRADLYLAVHESIEDTVAAMTTAAGNKRARSG